MQQAPPARSAVVSPPRPQQSAPPQRREVQPQKAQPPATNRPAPRRSGAIGGISAEERKRLMAEPLVRRAVELSNGSIVDVVRRIPNAAAPNGGEVEDDAGVVDDADDAVVSAAEDSDDDGGQAV